MKYLSDQVTGSLDTLADFLARTEPEIESITGEERDTASFMKMMRLFNEVSAQQQDMDGRFVEFRVKKRKKTENKQNKTKLNVVVLVVLIELARPQNRKLTFCSSSQAATCPPVYHIVYLLHEALPWCL